MCQIFLPKKIPESKKFKPKEILQSSRHLKSQVTATLALTHGLVTSKEKNSCQMQKHSLQFLQFQRNIATKMATKPENF